MKKLDRHSDSLNILDFIYKASTTAFDDCRSIAQSFVIRTGHEHDQFWNNSSEAMLAAFIGVVVNSAEPKDKNLQSVRAILTNGERLKLAIRTASESDTWGGMLARAGGTLAQLNEKEFTSVVASAHQHSRWLDTLAVAESTRTSSFDPVDLLNGKMTIYLVMPPEHMRTQAALLRMWIGFLLREVVKGGLQETNKVHFLIDEAASVSGLESLKDALDKYRAYGVRLILFYQSLGQLKEAWPNGEQTLLSNVTKVFFSIQDIDTANYVSQMLGKTTIRHESGGRSTSKSYQPSKEGQGQSYSTSTNDNWQYGARELLQPSELLNLPGRVALTFTPGVPPIATWLLRYFDSDFQTRRDIGFTRALIEALCLFLTVSLIAVLFTASIMSGHFK